MNETQNAEDTTPNTVEAAISVTSRGTGYINMPDDNDAFVEAGLMNTALHNDTVRAAIYPQSDGSRTAEVLEVLIRAKTDFVGTVRRENDVFFVEAQDMRMYADFVVPNDRVKGANPGDKVLIRLMSWSDPKRNPLGEVLEVIGPAGTNETEMRAIVLERGFAISFPEEVEAEAAAIKNRFPETFKNEKQNRRDMRETPTFTIDPASAKDFDDALSVRELENGNTEIGIHIADVAFFVEEGSELDREAKQRGTSIYLVDRTIPMLPEVLSNDLCSLNPNEDKLAFSAVFEMNENAEVKKRWFGRTIIRSDHRFTYEDAQAVIDGEKQDMKTEMDALSRVAAKLQEKREEAGALGFEQDEVAFELDKDGKPIRIYKKPRYETMKLIENFMVLANTEVATFISTKDPNVEQTFIYRVHGVPDAEKLNELVRMLSALGYNVPEPREEYTQHDINTLLERVSGETHEHTVQMGAVRAMSKAVYSTENIGHFGLSLHHYTHFTSPIRRYPDIMVHRMLARYLADNPVEKDELEKYEALSRYATEMEIAASEAERASIKYKQAEYMQTRVGTKYDGVVTGVTKHGIFVRTDDTMTEGMIRLRDLKDDFYVLDETNFSIVGEKTGKTYTVGDRVRIKVLRVDLERRQIDFSLERK